MKEYIEDLQEEYRRRHKEAIEELQMPEVSEEGKKFLKAEREFCSGVLHGLLLVKEKLIAEAL